MLQPFSREAALLGPAEHGSAKTRRKHGLRTPRYDQQRSPEVPLRRGIEGDVPGRVIEHEEPYLREP